MTSSMTSQGGLKVGPLYYFINEIITFFMITKQRAKISSLNFLYICIIRLWLQLYEYIFMTSFMTSPSQKKGQILKLIYLRQYLNYSVENFEIWNTASIWPQIWKYRPKLCQKKDFHDDDVVDVVRGWPQSRPSIFLYIWNSNIFMISKHRSKISSLNFLCICIMRL